MSLNGLLPNPFNIPCVKGPKEGDGPSFSDTFVCAKMWKMFVNHQVCLSVNTHSFAHSLNRITHQYHHHHLTSPHPHNKTLILPAIVVDANVAAWCFCCCYWRWNCCYSMVGFGCCGVALSATIFVYATETHTLIH